MLHGCLTACWRIRHGRLLKHKSGWVAFAELGGHTEEGERGAGYSDEETH